MELLTIYIALLRGINVGGNNKIKMAELRAAMEQAGFLRVQTYIQSGNILFVAEEDADLLRLRLEQTIEQSFGLKIPVVLRTAQQLKQIIAGCPFTEEQIAAAAATAIGKCLHAVMLSDKPAEERVAKLADYASAAEQYVWDGGGHIYLLFYTSVHQAKLAVQVDKLGVTATTRNWQTLSKLDELADAMIE
ncbi:DUF1697 domain-containing protein [Paenibacillus sp. GCM10027626]|uniref:DUF1697 domain-containing protein n=1 Tax=Paenibacillus sp. GCM10027626 TaxID=3273411 RepID=UPI00363BCD6C